jgi:hypothetical protein
MSRQSPLVCLITSGHVASTPRLVKEADALIDAGYRVHVVAGRNFPAADPLDADIMERAKWKCTRVAPYGFWALYRKAIGRLARRLVLHPAFASVGIAARANNAQSIHLGSVAGRLGASLYIGHCVPALPAAALAARVSRSAYGFDAEDFHDAETDAVLHESPERSSLMILESRLLAGCAHLTTAAPLITRKYLDIYRVQPRTVLNVFPRSFAPAVAFNPGPISQDRPAIIYWFSQTVGHGRGLEEAVAILGRMRTPVVLHLRGFLQEGYAARLQSLASASGLRRPISFLAPGPPDEMARLAATADLGLSTEIKTPPNRDICLTNKIFIYLLAGIPQLLSETAAQSALAPELGGAAVLANLGEPEGAARALDSFLGQPERVAAAREAARKLAETRFCWDIEGLKFLDSVKGVVPLN